MATATTSKGTADPVRPMTAGEKKVILASSLGTVFEWYDFYLYGSLATIIGAQFFSQFPKATADIFALLAFAAGFLVRPFGALVFGRLGDLVGRKYTFLVTILIMGLSTFVVGLLPGYNSIGVAAPIILIGARLLQGLALGGTWDGLASLLALNAPEGRRGWYAMLPQLGAPVGLIVASALFAFFVGNLSAEDFFDWGWRYPFFVAFAINVVALFSRLRMVQTPSYRQIYEQRELQPSRVLPTLRAEGKNVVIGAFVPLVSFAMFHMVTVFPLSWVFLFTREGPARFLVIEAISAVFGLFAIVASGILADRIGRRRLLGGSAIAIAAFSGFAPQLLDAGFAGELTFMILGFILLGLAFGQSSGSVASRFSRAYRYTGSAMTTDLAWLFGAGFAPLVALILSSQFGLIASGAYLLSGALVTMLVLWLTNVSDRGKA